MGGHNDVFVRVMKLGKGVMFFVWCRIILNPVTGFVYVELLVFFLFLFNIHDHSYM